MKQQKNQEKSEASPESLRAESSTGVEYIDGKNPAAVALGRLGGLKGGRARAERLSAQERKAIAVKAAIARWSKQGPNE